MSSTHRLGLMAEVVSGCFRLSAVGVDFFRRGLMILMFAGSFATPLKAVNIIYTIDPLYGVSAEALSAFEEAASMWESRLVDPVTVSIKIGAYDFGPGYSNIIGGASPTYHDISYSQYRAAYEADAGSDADFAVLATLSSGPSYQRYVNAVYPGWNVFIDSNRYISMHDNVRLAGANAKALGFSLGPADAADAMINFNTAVGFDYDRTDGISPGMMDFVGVAAHEIGHALGFTSIVNDVDSGQNFMTVLPSMPMDFIRYSAQSEQWAVHDVSIESSYATQRRYIKIGDTNIPMSTGLVNGDGYQASHFLNDVTAGGVLGLMDPNIALGETLNISDYDLLVFDAIGWNLAVPEPSTCCIVISASIVMLLRRKRCVLN